MYNILVADDERIERQGVISLLKRLNMDFQFFEAENGKKALQILESNPIDIVITDIKMPIMDGIELVKKARALSEDIFILLNSAFGEFEYAQEALKHNVFSYILKPVEIEEFNAIMHEVIKKLNERKAPINYDQYELETGDNYAITKFVKKYKPTDQMMKYAENFKAQGRFLYLLVVETNKTLIEKHDEMLEKYIHKYIPYDCFTIESYETQKTIGILSDELISNNLLMKYGEKIISKVERIYGETLFLLFSDPIDDVINASKELDSLSILEEYRFFLNRSSVFVKKSDAILSNNYPSMIDSMLQSIYEYIEFSEFDKVMDDIKRLISTMSDTDGLSALYTKHIFLDIMDKIYKQVHEYEFHNMENNMRAIMSSTDLVSLSNKVIEMIDEIRSKQGGKEEMDSAVDLVVHHIKKEYFNDIGLEYLAEKVDLSPNYLSYLFKKNLGISLVKYINKYRLEKAKHFLKETNLKIVEVSSKVGFSNCTYFVTVFKNEFDITPSKYRQKLRH